LWAEKENEEVNHLSIFGTKKAGWLMTRLPFLCFKWLPLSAETGVYARGINFSLDANGPTPAVQTHHSVKGGLRKTKFRYFQFHWFSD